MNREKIIKSLLLRLPKGQLFNWLLLCFKDVFTLKVNIEDWYCLKIYFLGTEKVYKSYLKFLEEKYWNKENNYFDFKVTKITKPSNYENKEEDFYFTLWNEFFDIVYPEIFKKISIFVHDGPYFYKNVEVKQGDIVIDAGANLGLFSALAAFISGDKIYAFEPVQWIIDKFLKKLVALYPSQIEIMPFALSDSKKEILMDINLEPIKIGHSSFVVARTEFEVIKEKIQTISLDEWVEENKIPRIDFIKADIEGAERLLLKGAKKVLKEFTPKLSICTYHLFDDKEVLPELILAANPNYKIVLKWRKLYAWV